VIRLTFSRNWEEQPVWIDNGKSLVFMRCIGRVGSPTSKWYLYRKNLLNGREKRLFEVGLGIEIKSSENLYLLRHGGFDIVYYLNRDSGSLTKIFAARDIGISILGPGSGIWYFSVDKRETKFALVIAEGIRVKGKELAKEWDKCCEIAIVNRDGTNLQILTNDTFPDFSSAISPDCQSIAFESERDGNGDIYLMEIATKELKRLTNHPSRDYSPTWSPDGEKIAFISERDGFSHIWVINADGTGLYQLTKGEFHVWPGISWSPR
jgi:Tol biopolymer transport system component